MIAEQTKTGTKQESLNLPTLALGMKKRQKTASVQFGIPGGGQIIGFSYSQKPFGMKNHVITMNNKDLDVYLSQKDLNVYYSLC